MKSFNRNGFTSPLLLSLAAGFCVIISLVFIYTPEASSKKTTTPDTTQSKSQLERFDINISASDTFYGVMRGFDLSPQEIRKLTKAARPFYRLSRLRQGSVVSVLTREDRVVKVLYKINPFEVLVLEKDGEAKYGYKAVKRELPREVRLKKGSGVIESSLYRAAMEADVPPAVVLSLSDVFAWDVDFNTDMREGDTFKVLYEQIYVEGEFVENGAVRGAEVTSGGRDYKAIYYKDSRGRSGYYDLNGRSLRKMLMKSPLRYRRISSYFSNRRYHPILKKYRAHHGIDYAAPRGTPVEAAGSGKVTFAGWKSGYGRFVTIKHSNGYSTGYGHFSKIRKGIRRGARVEQGDVIGYVGSTGISTGPHLHYEVRKGKRLINPLRIKGNPAKAVSGAEKAAFVIVKNDVLKKLSTEKAVLSAYR
ncbi:MAG: peptidoglycan DD-metalloendopeptidase family protein [Thermodesulfobacteriota bacterium]